jgi:hypothetical protein
MIPSMSSRRGLESAEHVKCSVEEHKSKPDADAWLAVLTNRDKSGARFNCNISSSPGDMATNFRGCDPEMIELLAEVTGASVDKRFLGHVLQQHGQNPAVCSLHMNSLPFLPI